MPDRQPTPGVHENFADKVSAHDFIPSSTMSELKPCPFCGGDRLKHFGKEIQCQQCQALGPLPADGEVTRQIVIDWWNRRAAAPEPAASRQQSYICIADGRNCKVTSQDDGLVCFVWDGSETTRYLGAVEFEKRFRPAPPPPQSHVRVTDLHVEAAKLALVKHSVLMPTDAAIRDMLAAAASLNVSRTTTEGSDNV